MLDNIEAFDWPVVSRPHCDYLWAGHFDSAFPSSDGQSHSSAATHDPTNTNKHLAKHQFSFFFFFFV